MRRLSTLPRRGWLLAAVAALVLLVAGLAWLRDSPLVAVDEVTITGASGPDAPKIEAALRSVAREMTTLHVREEELHAAVDTFPTVGDLKVESDFPDAMRIEVIEREPVAVVAQGDDRMPVTAGGTVLRGATAPDDLPLIDDSRSERVLELLGAAPRPLLRRAERAFAGPRGLTVRMAEGPIVYFGSASDLEAKWAAAARVLADPTAEGATYVDVRVPERTAAGGLTPIEEEDGTEEELAPGATAGEPAPNAAPPADPAATTPADPAAPATSQTTPPAAPETAP
ncbi:MAG TPA: cell division protein FtsQ/DivIB [Solirubrobacteraceae bacterium]|nr:cell division protein FtsQ/DivIB [Solirubrobacteraceae bacterium]